MTAPSATPRSEQLRPTLRRRPAAASARRPSFPRRTISRSSLRYWKRTGDAGRPRHGGQDPHRHAPGRDLRPGRVRLPPLLHRRRLAAAPLREDALRPGPDRHGLPRGLPGHAATGPHGRDRPGDLHLCAPRHDRRPRADSTAPRTRTARASKGKFYVWTTDGGPEQILGAGRRRLLISVCSTSKTGGNFTHEVGDRTVARTTFPTCREPCRRRNAGGRPALESTAQPASFPSARSASTPSRTTRS